MPELFSTLKHAGLTLSLDTNDDPHGKWSGVLDQLEDRVPTVVVKCGPRGAIDQQGHTRTFVEAPRVYPSTRSEPGTASTPASCMSSLEVEAQ